MSCGLDKSLASAFRFCVLQPSAPERQALASGTMWSMSTALAEVRVLPLRSSLPLRGVATCVGTAPAGPRGCPHRPYEGSHGW